MLKSLLCKRDLDWRCLFFAHCSRLGVVGTTKFCEMSKQKIEFQNIHSILRRNARWEDNAFQFLWNRRNEVGISVRNMVCTLSSLCASLFNNKHLMYLKSLITAGRGLFIVSYYKISENILYTMTFLGWLKKNNNPQPKKFKGKSKRTKQQCVNLAMLNTQYILN